MTTRHSSDPLRQAALELVQAARSFLDLAEQALADDEAVAEWTERGRGVVHAFIAGFTGHPAGGGGGVEHIEVD